MNTTDTYGATYVDHMGTDLTVVNAARVSFAKESTWEDICECGAETPSYGWPCSHGGCNFTRRLRPADANLIRFLGRGMTAADFDRFVNDVSIHGAATVAEDMIPEQYRAKLIELLWRWRQTPEHWAPFAHPHVTFHITAPIFVARQLAKHQVGFVWSEVSRRYVDDAPTFYLPETWRCKAANVKQGSSDDIVTTLTPTSLFSCDRIDTLVGIATENAAELYERMVDGGVCPEQARMVLPQSMLTEWRWTGSLYGWSRVCNQRLDSHAQVETRRVAEDINAKMAELFPVSWEALRP